MGTPIFYAGNENPENLKSRYDLGNGQWSVVIEVKNRPFKANNRDFRSLVMWGRGITFHGGDTITTAKILYLKIFLHFLKFSKSGVTEFFLSTIVILANIMLYF